MASIQIPIPDSFQDEFASLLKQTAKEVLAEAKQQELHHGKDFMTLTECGQYMNVSYGTLVGVWINQLGLKKIEIQGKSYISKKTLLEFLNSYEI